MLTFWLSLYLLWETIPVQGLPVTSAEPPQDEWRFGTPGSHKITCVGEIPPRFSSPQYAGNLAQLCALEAGAGCVTDHPQHLAFTGINSERAASEGNYDYDEESDVQQQSRIEQIAELCYIKCNCTTLNGARNRALLQGSGPPPGFGLWSPEDVEEWDFYTRSATTRPRISPREKAYWKDTEPRATADSQQLQFFVGDESNRPYCERTAFSITDSQYITSRTTIYEHGPLAERYKNAKDLCLHRYYGGNNFTNVGGICRRTAGINRLVFPNGLRAPVFTQHWPRPSAMESLQFAIFIESFCEERCWCQNEQPPSVNDTASSFSITSMGLRGCTLGQSVESYGSARSQCNTTSDAGLMNMTYLLDMLNSSTPSSTQRAPTGLCGGNCTMGKEDEPEAKPSCPGSAGACQCMSLQPIDPLGFGDGKWTALCLAVSAVKQLAGTAAVRKGAGSSRPNGKRDWLGRFKRETRDDGMREMRVACPCNRTYVSKACCGSGDDGLVWEAPGSKLGELL